MSPQFVSVGAPEIRATPNPEPPIANGSFYVPESLGTPPMSPQAPGRSAPMQKSEDSAGFVKHVGVQRFVLPPPPPRGGRAQHTGGTPHTAREQA